MTRLRVCAVVATGRPETGDGELRFYYRALRQLAREADRKPIYDDFRLERTIGRVVAAHTRKVEVLRPGLENGEGRDELGFTIVEAHLDFYDPNGNDWYIVPQIMIRGDDWELTAFGLTQTPGGGI